MYGFRMARIAQRMISPCGRSAGAEVRRTRPRIEALEARLVLSSSGNTLYLQTNLVSDMQGMAQQTDPNLKDPWGISFSATSPFWVSDQAANFKVSGATTGSGATTVYKVSHTQPPSSSGPLLTVGIPNQGDAPPNLNKNGPTGQVNTDAPGITTSPTDFPLNGNEASFIFANMDGSISAWNGGAHATIMASVAGASFTGLAIANDKKGASFIYAADQNSGDVLIFNSKWATTGGKLTDPIPMVFPPDSMPSMFRTSMVCSTSHTGTRPAPAVSWMCSSPTAPSSSD